MDKNWAPNPNLKNLEKTNTVWVDITCLLHLPQKEASRVLGISVSLLCKRFKEATNRKWPQRLLKKVRKELPEENGDDSKLAKKLSRVEEKCLSNAQIRLTRPVECHDEDYMLVPGPAKNTLVLLPKRRSADEEQAVETLAQGFGPLSVNTLVEQANNLKMNDSEDD